MRMPWQQSWAPAAAFATLAVIGGIALSGQADAQADKLYQSQLSACKRVNNLRVESNERIEAHTVDRDALIAFLKQARIARLAAYDRDKEKVELDTAKEYKRLIDMLEEKVVFDEVDIVNCKKVIKKP